MQVVRRDETLSSWFLAGAIVLMMVGFIHAQGANQDVINATIQERIAAMTQRIDKLETAQNYGLGALFANLAAHLFQVKANLRRRRRRDEDDD